MEEESPLSDLPNEILSSIFKHCAAVSLPTLCFATSTCQRFRYFRHISSISSICNRKLSSIFDSEARECDKGVTILSVKGGSRKFWVLHARQLDIKEVRAYRFGVQNIPPPKRRPDGFSPRDNEPSSNLILSELLWVSKNGSFKFQLLPWIGNHKRSVSVAQVAAHLGNLRDDETRYIASYVIAAFRTLHARYSRILGRITLKKLLFQPDGEVVLVCTDVACAQKEIWIADFRPGVHLAPEQVQAQPAVGPSVDFWIIGSVIYQLAFGSIAFEKDNPIESMHHLGSPTVNLSFPEEDSRNNLYDLLRQLLKKHAASRLSSFEALCAHPFFDGIPWATMLEPDHVPAPPPRLRDCLMELFSQDNSAAVVEQPADLANVFLPGWLEVPESSKDKETE